MAHSFSLMDICISQSSIIESFKVRYNNNDIIYFTCKSVRKSFIFLPTTSVQGSDGSRWAGSKKPGIISSWPRSSSFFGGVGFWISCQPTQCTWWGQFYFDIGSYVTWWRYRYTSSVICLYSLSFCTPSIVFQQVWKSIMHAISIFPART